MIFPAIQAIYTLYIHFHFVVHVQFQIILDRVVFSEKRISPILIHLFQRNPIKTTMRWEYTPRHRHVTNVAMENMTCRDEPSEQWEFQEFWVNYILQSPIDHVYYIAG